MIAHRVEGIVIAPVSDRSQSTFGGSRSSACRSCSIDRTVPGIESDVVLGDSVGGARQLVEHLISLGHRRIGLIVESDDVSTARDRRRGYESALTAAGLPARSGARRRRDGRSRAAASRGCAGCSRSRIRPRPSSPSTTSSRSARSRRCARPVSRFPDDVALVCFDDIEYASRLYPFLTVMEQPAETFGTLGTQLLLDRIAGRGPQRPGVVVLPAEFVVRQSCGGSRRADAA